MRNINIDEVTASRTDPLQAALRKEIKLQLVSALELQLDPFRELTPPTEAVLMGSSLFSMSSREFPFAGRKTEDFDIRVEFQPSHSTPFPNVKQRATNALWQAFEQAIDECGFGYVMQGTVGYREKGEVRRVIIHANFLPDEARNIVDRSRFPTEDEISGVQDAYLEMELLGPDIVTNLFPTDHQISGINQKGEFPLRWDNPRQYVSKILARSLIHNNFKHTDSPTDFKAPDVLNLYNVTNANPKVLNLDQSSTDSDLAALRLGTIVNLAILRKDLEVIHIDSFKPNRDAIDALYHEIVPFLVRNHDLTHEIIAIALESWHELLKKIFPEPTPDDPPTSTGLHLTHMERQFIEQAQGYLSATTNGQYRSVPPQIKVETLEDEIPEPFLRDPLLSDRISFSPGLRDYIYRLNSRRT